MTTTSPPHAPEPVGEAAQTAPAIPAQASPKTRSSRARRFVSEMERLCAQDAGARSALRSGLRKGLDEVPRMHRLVAPWLPEGRVSADTERAYYSVAAMIAAQPRSSTSREDLASDKESTGRVPSSGVSLGTAFALAVSQGPGREKEMRANTAESRLNLLTRQSVSGLHRHLPASVGYLRSLDVPVDWAQLLLDLSFWRRDSGRISRRWLQDFYRLRAKTTREQADLQDEEEAEELFGSTSPAADDVPARVRLRPRAQS